MPGRAATGPHIFNSLVRLGPRKRLTEKAGFEPGSAVFGADALSLDHPGGLSPGEKSPHLCHGLNDIIIIIIIIAFKGTIRDFLQSPHSAANCLQHICSSGPGATNHMQHIERLSRASVMLCATWYEGTAQLLSLTELKLHLFELYFIG